jgi:cell wall-associated NlpC family hydrolase
MNNKEILTMFFYSVMGLPYKWGGMNPISGLDCSGFVQEALSTIGLDPAGDQTADALYRYFSSDKLGKKNITQFGSLLFFGSESAITHIAIALNDKIMIEAGGGGSKTLTKDDAIAQNAYIRIRPINRRKDLVKAILPVGI